MVQTEEDEDGGIEEIGNIIRPTSWSQQMESCEYD